MRLPLLLLGSVALAGCFRVTLPETHYERRVFEQALRTSPDLAHAHWMLGRRAMYEGEYRAAIRHFDLAASAQPDFLEAQIAMGRCWLNLGQPRRALGPLGRALVLAPQSARALELRGQALMETGDEAGARQSLEQALMADPDSFLAHAKLGEMAYGHGDLEEAISHWRAAVSLDLGDPAWKSAQDDLRGLLEDVEHYHTIYPSAP